jgi:hypothetical protein
MTTDFTVRPYDFIGELEPESRIADYVLEEQIGVSETAAAFRTRDEAPGRLPAVKVIAPPMADGPEFRAPFLQEPREVAVINSQHVIPVHEADEAEGTPAIARSQQVLPRDPSSSVSAVVATRSGAAALRESRGYASTIGGGNGNAGSAWSPLTEGHGIPPKRKRLTGQRAVIGGTVAVILAAAALIYAVGSTGPSRVAVGSTGPSRVAVGPTGPSRGTSAASATPTPSVIPSVHGASYPSSSPAVTSASPTTGTPNAVTGQATGQVPGQVTGITATPGDGTVALAWQAPPGNPTGYQVAVSPAPAGQNATLQVGSTKSDQVTGLTNGTTYTFTVLASNAQGNGPQSAGVTAVPFGKPLTMAAPTAEALPIGATGAGSHSSATVTTFAVNVTVGSSTGNGAQITSYTIYAYKAASSSGPWTEVSSATANAQGGGMVVHAGEALFDMSNDGSWYEFTAAATTAAGTSAQSPLSSPAIQAAAAPATSPPTAVAP